MLVSIVTVCWNAAESIERTLESVRRQTSRRLEHVIVDGASTDNTLEIIRRAARDGAVVSSEPDQGIYDAMNKGIARSSGDLIYFLNAGDELVDASVVDDLIRFFEQSPQVDAIYGALEVVDLDGSAQRHLPPPAAQAAEELVRGCLPHQAAVARRRVFDITKGFDPRYKLHADHDWFVKIVFHPEIVVERLDRSIGRFYLGGASSKIRETHAEFYAIQNAFPAYQSEAWLRRRIEIMQEAILQYRLQLEQATAALRVLREQAASNAAHPHDHSVEEREADLVAADWRGRLAEVRAEAARLSAQPNGHPL